MFSVVSTNNSIMESMDSMFIPDVDQFCEEVTSDDEMVMYLEETTALALEEALRDADLANELFNDSVV